MTNGWELISFLYKFISSKKKKENYQTMRYEFN